MKRLIAVLVAVAVAGAALMAIPAFGATKSISLRDNFFSPKSVSVKRNTTVRFVWRGRAPHNVTVRRGPVKFRSSTKSRGTYRKKMTRRGTYRIVCTIHPGMNLTLRVR
jgi:plastocyanin